MVSIKYSWSNVPYKIYYGVIPAREIVNALSPDDQMLRKNAQFYRDLERSLEEEGVRNPILVSLVRKHTPTKLYKEKYAYYIGNGEVFRFSHDKIPQEKKDNKSVFLCDYGGSRLYIMAKKNKDIPCLISDLYKEIPRNHKDLNLEEMKSFEEIQEKFGDEAKGLALARRGLTMKLFKTI